MYRPCSAGYPVPLARTLHGACPGMQVRVRERGGAPVSRPGSHVVAALSAGVTGASTGSE